MSTASRFDGPAHRAVHQRHRLGGGGALVEHRRVGDLQPGEVGDHGLEVQQRLEPALADLGLIRRVGGVPGRVLKDVAAQHRWRERVEVALPDHRHRDGVGVGQRAQLGQRLVLGGGRRQVLQTRARRRRRTARRGCRGQRLVGQFVERSDADGLEHAWRRRRRPGRCGGRRKFGLVCDRTLATSPDDRGAEAHRRLLPLCRRPVPGA